MPARYFEHWTHDFRFFKAQANYNEDTSQCFGKVNNKIFNKLHVYFEPIVINIPGGYIF